MTALQANDLEFYQIHLQKIMENKPNSDSLFGLLVCTYNNLKVEKGYYNPPWMNIGDYIQSLAQLQFLPQIDELVDRDQLALYQNEPIKMIMNAWYWIWAKNEIFSDKITPLMLSVHINNTEKLNEKTLEYFKQHEPIGCRDIATRDYLLDKGIMSYFSGCLTLTLGLSYKVNEYKRNHSVYFVDCRPETLSPQIHQRLKTILQKYNKLDFNYISHVYPLYADPLANLRKAEILLQEYAKASLVITSRLHCALPCLSLGTPVIFIPYKFDHKRYHGLINLLNYIYIDDNNNLQKHIKFDIFSKVTNSNDYLLIQNKLTSICKSFTNIQQLHFTGLKQINNYIDFMQETNQYMLNTTNTLKNAVHEINILKKQIVTPPPAIIQQSHVTQNDRYPLLFNYLQGTNRQKILSFGCSTGEEVYTLSEKYVKNCELIGYDVSINCIESAVANFHEHNCNKIYFTDQLDFMHYQNYFDIILCLSCLCLWTQTQNKKNISNILPYAKIHLALYKIHKMLKIGGILMITNSNYSFENSLFFKNYDAITEPNDIGFVTRFLNNGDEDLNTKNYHSIFRKKAD